MNRRNWFNSAFVGVLGLCGFKLQETQDWQWWYNEKTDVLYLELNGINVAWLYDVSNHIDNLHLIMDLKKQEKILNIKIYKLYHKECPPSLKDSISDREWKQIKKQCVKFEV